MNEDLRVWSFDVSALMVLVGENEESNYRSMERSFLECLNPFPVVGLQCYLRSYDWLLPHSSLNLFSPFNCKPCPLSNNRLASAIMRHGYLDDGTVTVFKIPESGGKKEWTLGTVFTVFWDCFSLKWKPWQIYSYLWFAFSWISFAGLMFMLFELPDTTTLGPTTFIGCANCIAYSSWSLLVRLLEYFRVKRHKAERRHVTNPDDKDAVFILGRRDACFVLEGSRFDIKNWTEVGLLYRGTAKKDSNSQQWFAWFLKGFLRFGTLLLLLFIFTTMPNGSTADQVIFIMFNMLGQANVLLGRRLNARRLFDSLEEVENVSVETRTHTYGYLLRRYPEEEAQGPWIDIAGLFPDTEAWTEWKRRVIEDKNADAKDLYDEIVKEIAERKGVHPPPTKPQPPASQPTLPPPAYKRESSMQTQKDTVKRTGFRHRGDSDGSDC